MHIAYRPYLVYTHKDELKVPVESLLQAHKFMPASSKWILTNYTKHREYEHLPETDEEVIKMIYNIILIV